MSIDALVKDTSICFVYDGKARELKVDNVKTCGNGKQLVVGKQVDGTWRSFDYTKMQHIAPSFFGWGVV